MAIPITVPRLGWNMDEGVFGGWLKQEGDLVHVGDTLFSLEGEKATEEIECLDEGRLRIAPTAPKAGETVAIGTLIAYLVQPGETSPFESVDSPKSQTLQAADRPVSECLLHKSSLGDSKPRPTTPSVITTAEVPTSSPRARRLAKELGVDWTKIQGTGRTGRIRERDVRAAAPSNGNAQPMSAVRKTIAQRMLHSHMNTAPVTLTTSADATNLVNLRNQFKASQQAGNEILPGYTEFLVKLLAAALSKHPILNARWSDEQIVHSPAIDIGIAVDTDAGLLVPVVRDVSSLSLKEISTRVRDLSERARQRRLSMSEMQGGTFTLTNLGAFGIDAFTPIINDSQCAILGVGRIQKQPVVFQDQIVARDRITLSLTFDHRIVDGAPAARFLQTLTLLIENPGPWLMP